MFLDDEDRVLSAKERLAARKAKFEQNEKRVNEQYAWYPPFVNRCRMDTLEVEKFGIAIDEYELNELLQEKDISDEA